MPFSIQIMPSALAELKALKVYYRRQVALAIEKGLTHQPLVESRNRKPLGLAPASFE